MKQETMQMFAAFAALDHWGTSASGVPHFDRPFYLAGFWPASGRICASRYKYQVAFTGRFLKEIVTKP